jgi:hypothetical protein
VVNCSAPHYNLGAERLADWRTLEGDEVTRLAGDPGMFVLGFDKVYLSAIFSWHTPIAREIVARVKGHADVEAGGPGFYAVRRWFALETGVEPWFDAEHGHVDPRFEHLRGAYRTVAASRGCPVGCWFCIVPKIEGRAFTLDWEFAPAPILTDNNLSALPLEFQRHIVARYAQAGMRLADANSGFEPATFCEDTFEIWREALKGPWRFAFDEQAEAEAVHRVANILGGVSARKKQVYVLSGNEPIASCYERALKVIEWGCEPWVQYVLPLNYLGDPRTLVGVVHKHDWTTQSAIDFRRYFGRRLWRSFPLSEYRPRIGVPAPFAAMAKSAE